VFTALLAIQVLAWRNILLTSWRFRWVGGVLISLLFFMAGYGLCYLSSDRERALRWMEAAGSKDNRIFLAEVASDPRLKGKSVRADIRLIDVTGDSTGNSPGPQGLRALAYFQHDSAMSIPERGDILMFRSRPEPLPGPANRGEFDFRKYMADRNVFIRCYLNAEEWKKVGHRSHLLPDLASQCREFVYLRLQRAGVEGAELALVAALLLGMTGDIEQDVIQSYSTTGAMHVLSVSGLHVGIIYMVLNFLFKSFSRIRNGEKIRFGIILAFIWFYSLIAGLSPSILRASIMFSFLQAGKLIRNQPPAMNTLAAAAFILLVMDPMTLNYVGFQFSFLAVVGILAFTEPLQSLWKPRLSLIGNGWSLVAVSIAAQIATGPLSVHYFQQFPVLFLLTNLMIIPLTTITMYLALMVLSMPVPFVAELLGTGLTYSLKMMTGSVRLVGALPGASISSINLPWADTLFIYLFILFLFLFLIMKMRKAIIPALCSLVIIIGLADQRMWVQLGKREVTVYSLRGQTCLDLVDGRRCWTVASENILPGSISYSIQPNRTMSGISECANLGPDCDTLVRGARLFRQGNCISFNGYDIFLADSSFMPMKVTRVVADLVVVTGGFRGGIEDLAAAVDFKTLVADGSMPPWELDRLLGDCSELGLECHAVSSEGCFRVTL